MRRWWLVLALMLSLGINVGVVAMLLVERLRATAVSRNETPPPVLQGVAERFGARLGLEGEQRDRFVQVQRAFVDRTWGQRRRLLVLREELRRELARDEPDLERIDGLLAETSRIQAELDRALVEMVLEVHGMLSPEQREPFLRGLGRLRDGGGAVRRPMRPLSGQRGPGGRRPPPEGAKPPI
ncbi:MAG TPA: periplasmic heavy metal sensor [Thermoanaerobaculia bacterium]|nr:periplasmic heavy metal sensor [Thermoanaerobaculia bacterium]